MCDWIRAILATTLLLGCVALANPQAPKTPLANIKANLPARPVVNRTITLAWEYEDIVDNFTVFRGSQPGAYSTNFSVPPWQNFAVVPVTTGPNYFAATATLAGQESEYSNEVMWQAPPPPPPRSNVVIVVTLLAATNLLGTWIQKTNLTVTLPFDQPVEFFRPGGIFIQ